MTRNIIGYGLSAGVIVTAIVGFPPVAAFGVGLAIITRPTMRRFAEQLEAELHRDDAAATELVEDEQVAA